MSKSIKSGTKAQLQVTAWMLWHLDLMTFAGGDGAPVGSSGVP